MKRRWLVFLGAAFLAACTVEPAAVSRSDTAAVFLNQAEQFEPRDYAGTGLAGRSASALAETEGTTRDSSPVFGVTSSMIIRTANASIEVDSLEPAVALLSQLAEQVGGYVAGTGIVTGKGQLRQAFIEVKIPAPRFDEVVAGLKPIGKLESVNVNTQDVGEEFVDVTARMDNAKRLERRLIDLLATRTGKLKDVLDVEQSLARVREEIERYQGRIRYLAAHTAMSTLSVSVHEPLPVVGEAGHSVMGEAFTQAWRNFVVLVSLTVQGLGVILPVGLVAGGAWFVMRRRRTLTAPIGGSGV
ncbi:MAG TPA: DUF4349 domain-containing protein [Gemmatimonadales bacterium]